MAKTGLSDVQINRVNELAFGIWNVIMAMEPEGDGLPAFLRDANKKSEYAAKDAITLALRTIYIPDSRYGGDFDDLICFMAARFESCRKQVKKGAADKTTGRIFAELGGIFCRIGEMAADKSVHARKN